MAFCTQCGTRSTEGQRFCVVCGSALPVPSGTPVSPPTPDSSPAPGAMPSWTPAPPLSPEQSAEAWSAQVLVGFATEPPVQSRLTILFRIILAIPLLLWSALLSFAAGFCVIVSWFAALFTGRVPAGFQEFNTDVLRYTTEVQAYCSVLVTRWPGFSLHPGDKQQVSLQITQFKLNRGAVFFRYFLALPASAVLFLVDFGSYALTVAVWVSALILGRPAKPLYQARLLCMRYSTRYSAYMFMLTPTQPFAGLFGDQEIPDVTSPSDASAALSTRIHASRWARTFLVLSLIAGAFGGVIYLKRVGNFKNLIDNSIVVPMVNTAQKNVTTDVKIYRSSCISQSSAACGINAAVTARDAIATQISTLTAGEVFVNQGRSQFLEYVAALTKVNSDFSLIAGDATLTQQQSDVTKKLLPDIAAFDAEYKPLRAAI
jgi:hypothetical protein